MCTVTIKSHNYEGVPMGAIIKGAIPFRSQYDSKLLGYDIKGNLLIAAGADSEDIDPDYDYFFTVNQANDE